MARRPVVIEPDPEAHIATEAPADFGDLAALAEADQGWRWQVHRLKSPDEMQQNPRGKPRIWVTTIHGPVDLADFHARRGGGVYEFWGSADGQLQTRVTIELDGPPKVQVEPPPPPPPIAAAGANGNGLTRSERLMIRLLRSLEARLERVERAPAPAEKSTITEMVSAIASLDGMVRQRAVAPASDLSVAKDLFAFMTAATEKGIEIGRGRDPLPAGEGGTDWVKVAETFVPLADRVLDRMAQAPGRAPVRPATAAASGAVAGTERAAPTAAPPTSPGLEVIEEPTPPITTARMMVVVDLLAQGVRTRELAADVADTIASILPAADLDSILQIPDQAVVDDIATRSSREYPELDSEAGKAYVLAVLRELRNPTEELEP